MRIGLNLLYLVPGEVGGSEIYARELVGAMATARPEWEFVVFCGREAADELPDPAWPQNVRLRALPVGARNKPARIAHELFSLPRVARLEDIDLLHSLGQTTPLWGRSRRVVTILDLIYHHHPATFPRSARLGLELLVPLGARRSARVLTISQATADDLCDTYGIERAKVDVTLLGAGFDPAPEPPDRKFAAAAIGIDPGEDFALSVASGHEHKNIPRLLEALATIPGRRLVVVGRSGLEDDRLGETARDLGIADRVTFTGWIEAPLLEALYRDATLFVYPTLREGFGLPVLEAMQRSLPVACSNASSLPEVAGDAALMFDPLEVTSIAQAVERLFEDPALREDLAARGRGRAAEFTWERCAEATLTAYERALGP